MRVGVGVVVGALATVVTWCGPQAAAQSDARKQPDAWKCCINEDKDSPELQISDCTSVIRSARESARSMAIIAFNNRRNAYHDEKEYDCAIANDGVAVKLDAPQPRNPDRTPAAPHSAWKPHPMQRWSPDFIPNLTGDAVDMKVIHRVIGVTGAEAMRHSKELAQKKGICVGIAPGGTFAGALQVCNEARNDATVVCMLPDAGERYLSTPLFADISIDMTEEELGISRSTPSSQLKPLA